MNSMGGLDVGDLAVGNNTKAWQVAIMVEHQMQFDGSLGSAKFRPVVHREAKVNDGRIQTDQLILEAKLLLPDRLGSDGLEKFVKHFLEQLPRAMAICIGQGRSRRSFDAKMRQFAFATLESAFDFTQGVRTDRKSTRLNSS